MKKIVDCTHALTEKKLLNPNQILPLFYSFSGFKFNNIQINHSYCGISSPYVLANSVSLFMWDAFFKRKMHLFFLSDQNPKFSDKIQFFWSKLYFFQKKLIQLFCNQWKIIWILCWPPYSYISVHNYVIKIWS